MSHSGSPFIAHVTRVTEDVSPCVEASRTRGLYSRRNFVRISLMAAGVVALGGSAGLLAGCASSSDEVYVESVASLCGLGYLGGSNRFAGIVAARGTKELNLQEGFKVDEVLVEVGQEVSAGDVLFVYDSEQADLALRKAKLELEQLESTLKAKRSEREQLERSMASASADAQLDYQIQIQSVDTDIIELEYNIATKSDEVSRAQESVDNLEVTSPLDGVVQSIDTPALSGTPTISESTGMAIPFMTLVETGEYLVKGYINEANVGELAEGTRVVAHSRVDDGAWYGQIFRIDWDNPRQGSSVSYGSSDDSVTSSSYPFYVELDSSDGLLLGQHVFLEIDYGQASADGLWLPEYYIQDVDSSPWVWAESASGKLEKRSIQVGERNADMGTYQVTSGLEAQDWIAFPMGSLTEGASCTHSQPASDVTVLEEVDQDLINDTGEVIDGTDKDSMAVDAEGSVDESAAEPAAEGASESATEAAAGGASAPATLEVR